MDLHANAALSWSGRRELARRIVDEGWTLTPQMGTPLPRRRSATPRSLVGAAAGGNRTPADRVAVIVLLRGLRMTAAEIAETLQMPLSTVSVVLKRQGMGRLGRIGLGPAVRYERTRPGELVHVDVKKLGRIVGVGHRISGSRASQHRVHVNGRKTGTAGWDYVHVAIDVECPRFRGQLSTGLSGPAERLSGHAKEAEVPKAVSARVSAGGGRALRPDRSDAGGDRW